ncbi:hypothetical protein PCLA_16r0076 [Pseudomonas citronellolis]|nr:hypothetical protein PCLA_16r0076 [Pseudomonas citronellolis]
MPWPRGCSGAFYSRGPADAGSCRFWVAWAGLMRGGEMGVAAYNRERLYALRYARRLGVDEASS